MHKFLLEIETLLRILSLVVGIGGAFGLFKYFKWKKRVRKTAIDTIERIVESIEENIANSEPKDYVTLEVVTRNGTIDIPFFKDKWVEIPPGGISIMLMNRSKESTVCALRCPLAQSIPHHHHMRLERIYVISGRVDELDKRGDVVRTYHSGEVWEIPKESTHSATFRNCLCNLTYIPTLPTGEEKPANLRAAVAALELLK